MSVILGLPSKGSLYEGTVSLLNDASLGLKSRGKGQSYWGKLKHVERVEVQYMRAEELPLRVASGEIQLAVTGLDLFKELNSKPDESFVLIDDLRFGHARLVAAVPNYWLDVESIEDLAEVAMDLKAKHNRNLRIGTKFTNLTRAFFEQQSLLDFSIVKSAGSTEAMPKAGAADLIVDLTSSGSTLASNNLKEIKGGTIVESQACLIGSHSISELESEDFQSVRQIMEMIEASLLSRDHCLIHFSIDEKKLNALKSSLSRENGCIVDYEPSVPQLETPGEKPVFSAIICPIKETFKVVTRMRQDGAFGISVSESSLMFGGSSNATERLRSLLLPRQSP